MKRGSGSLSRNCLNRQPRAAPQWRPALARSPSLVEAEEERSAASSQLLDGIRNHEIVTHLVRGLRTELHILRSRIRIKAGRSQRVARQDLNASGPELVVRVVPLLVERPGAERHVAHVAHELPTPEVLRRE